MAGATVTVYNAATGAPATGTLSTSQATTDSNGNYSVSNIPVGVSVYVIATVTPGTTI